MAREERETMSILFFIKKTKLLKNGEAPICLRLTLNKQIAEIRIKRSILVNRWSSAKGCALGKDKVAKELNNRWKDYSCGYVLPDSYRKPLSTSGTASCGFFLSRMT